MRTLVFFGSARKNGHTKKMLDMLLNELDGEKDIIDAYRTDITPCSDCRYCWKKKGCSIKDEMQNIYEKIESADNIVFASPVYFHSVTGKLKVIIDRLQVYWAGNIRGDIPEKPLRKGAILLVGGAPEFKDQFLGAEIVLSNLMNDLSCDIAGRVYFPDSDRNSPDANKDIAKEIMELGSKLNKK